MRCDTWDPHRAPHSPSRSSVQQQDDAHRAPVKRRGRWGAGHTAPVRGASLLCRSLEETERDERTRQVIGRFHKQGCVARGRDIAQRRAAGDAVRTALARGFVRTGNPVASLREARIASAGRHAANVSLGRLARRIARRIAHFLTVPRLREYAGAVARADDQHEQQTVQERAGKTRHRLIELTAGTAPGLRTKWASCEHLPVSGGKAARNGRAGPRAQKQPLR